MASIPSNLSRVPNSLASMITLGGLNSANADLLRLQTQMATLRRVNRPSDDPIAASLVNVIDKDMEFHDQRSRNLTHASSVLGVLDQRIGSLHELVLQSKTVASSQLGASSDAATRAQQATVVGSMVNELFATINSDYADLSLFAGGRTSDRAMEVFGNGYRYMGDREGMHTDLGEELDFALTLSADEVVGSLSSRVEGKVDLNAVVTRDTMLRDLRGPMEDVDKLGTIDVAISPGPAIGVDLSNAETIGDVIDILESAIETAAPGTLTGFGSGISIAGSGDRLQVNVAGGGTTVTFADGPAGQGATALGLAGVGFDLGTTTNIGVNADLDPMLTSRTAFADLNPSIPLDLTSDLVIRNGTKVGNITITPGMTLDEFSEEVRRLDLGVRVELSDNGDAIDIINEVSGHRMSVEESGGRTATTLGIRSVLMSTPLSEFNDGRGVEIAHGNVDENGAPDPNRNVDFEVTLSDAATTFTVDFTPSDMNSVAAMLIKINAEASAAGIPVGNGPGEFQAILSPTKNVIVLEDRLGGLNPIDVTSLNGYAAEDLGLLSGSSFGGTPATLTGTNRTSVRVDSLFSTMIELERALESDNERGITLAGERLEADLERLSIARANVGSRAQRVEQTQYRLEDRMLLDTEIKSDLQDLDFFEASSRFTLLQTQLQAAMTVAARNAPLSLMNFL